MKKKLLLAFSIVACLTIAFLPEQNIHGNTSSGPAGYTGSPFDSNGRTCGSGGGCHGGGTTNQPSIITTNIPACGYTPGQTYNITVTATSAGRTKFGFSLSAQKTSDGTTIGTLIAGSGSQLNGSNRYITHTSAGTAATGSGTRVWNFQWTAPVAGTGSVSLYAAVNCTNSGGNSSGDIIFNTSIAIQEGGIPVAPVISANGSNNICAGQSVTLNANSATGINWSTGASTQSINVTTAGSYTATAANACGTSPNSNTIVVSLTNPPSAPVISAVGPTNICAGQSVTLNSNTATDIAWSSGPTTQSINVNTSGNFTATATNSCGSATSNIINVTVTNPPAAPVVSAVGSTAICAGQTVTLNATGNNVTWSNGATSTSISVGAAGIFNATASNTCGSATSNNVSVTVTNPPAAPEVTVGANGLQFCEGQSTTLTASSVLPIIWTPGNFTTEQINVNTAGTYTASSTNICGTTNSLPVAVIVDPLPTPASITPNVNSTICAGESIVLTTDAQFSYSWSTSQTQPSITVFSPGEFYVSTANECGTVSSDTVIISVDSIPATPSIILNGNALESTLVGENYNWFFNGTPINSNQSSILPTLEGAYSLTISSDGGCSSDTSEAFNYISTNIYLNSEQDVKFFPNPVVQNESITILGNVKQNNAFDIFDLQGRLVYKVNAAQQVIQIPLAPGTYVLTSGTLRTKLIVNR